jgi:molybdenum cofactor biosynthesis enzyme MoaA
MTDNKYKSLDIEISSVCNMRCTNCDYSEGGKAKKGYMSIETFKNILDMAEKYEIKYIHLVGLGEQTLHPKFSELSKLLISYKSYFNIGITTNGTRIKEYYEILNSFDTVTISIDSAKETTYNLVRPGHDFNKLLVELELINTIRKRASFIINSQNVNEIESFINLCISKNFNEVYFEVANEPWLKKSNRELIFKSKKILENNKNKIINVTFKEPSKINTCDYFDKIIKIKYNNKLGVCPFINIDFDYLGINEIIEIKENEKLKVLNNSYKECEMCNHFINNKNYI